MKYNLIFENISEETVDPGPASVRRCNFVVLSQFVVGDVVAFVRLDLVYISCRQRITCQHQCMSDAHYL
jgi:hypothetical protein